MKKKKDDLEEIQKLTNELKEIVGFCGSGSSGGSVGYNSCWWGYDGGHAPLITGPQY